MTARFCEAAYFIHITYFVLLLFINKNYSFCPTLSVVTALYLANVKGVSI